MTVNDTAIGWGSKMIEALMRGGVIPARTTHVNIAIPLEGAIQVTTSYCITEEADRMIGDCFDQAMTGAPDPQAPAERKDDADG